MTDVDYARVMFGRHAVHVPAWLYVQDAGAGTVSFIGSSRLPTPTHPMRYGSDRTHQFVLGELILRPHLVVATDVFTGSGLSGLVADRVPDPDVMTRRGLDGRPLGERIRRYHRRCPMTTTELAAACRNLTDADDTVRAHTESHSDNRGWYVLVPAEDLDALHRCVQQATEAAR